MIRITVKVNDQPETVHEVNEYAMFTAKHTEEGTNITGNLTCTENFKRLACFELMREILAPVDNKAGQTPSGRP